MGTRRVFSGAPWEKQVGYSRAVLAGNLISVGGTAPVAPGGGTFAPGDAYAQARRCLEIIDRALDELGADRSAVTRTRMFVTDISRWAEYGRAHQEFFGDTPPATSMVQVAALISPDMLIEIEADAVLPENRFEEALAFAYRLHRDQRRKGGKIPYVAHLLGVASLVLEHGGSEDEAIAALLHDAVEDQGGPPTREEIRRRFGDNVAHIVDGCTDTDVIPKPPWRARKESYLEHLRTASPSVRLVSAADKLHNARTILADYRACGEELWKRFAGKKDGTLWYYRALVDAFRAHGPHPLVEELGRVVAELERLATGRGGA